MVTNLYVTLRVKSSLNENQRQIEARREDERTAKLREHVASVKHYYSVKQWVSEIYILAYLAYDLTLNYTYAHVFIIITFAVT